MSERTPDLCSMTADLSPETDGHCRELLRAVDQLHVAYNTIRPYVCLDPAVAKLVDIVVADNKPEMIRARAEAFRR